MLFGGHGTHCFARKRSRDYEKEKPSPFLKKFLRQSQPSTPEPEPKRLNWVQIWSNCICFLLVDELSDIITFRIILFNFNIQSTDQIYTVNLQKIMIFTVSNDGIQ